MFEAQAEVEVLSDRVIGSDLEEDFFGTLVDCLGDEAFHKFFAVAFASRCLGDGDGLDVGLGVALKFG